MGYKIPIFVTIFDRLAVLKESIQSYIEILDTPIEVIICDQGTTYQPTLDWVKNCGFKYYKGKNEPTSVKHSIEDWYKTNDATHYVVTDPDISVEGTHPNMLNTCMDILALEKDITCVGPGLRIWDIPNYYPMKEQVQNWEKQWYKPEDKKVLRINNEIITYYFSVIDTTFAVYRKGHEFTKPNTKAIRVTRPYNAKHLDWYMDHDNLTDDYKYYIESAKKADKNRTHWSSMETAHK